MKHPKRETNRIEREVVDYIEYVEVRDQFLTALQHASPHRGFD